MKDCLLKIKGIKSSGYQLDTAYRFRPIPDISPHYKWVLTQELGFLAFSLGLGNIECGRKNYAWLNTISPFTLILHFMHVQPCLGVPMVPARSVVIHSCLWVVLGSVRLVCSRLLLAQRAACSAKLGESCTPASTKREHPSWTTVPWLGSATASSTVCMKSCILWSARQERETAFVALKLRIAEIAPGLQCWHWCSPAVQAP